jgi:DNA-binding NarL/FixJ family response regulator
MKTVIIADDHPITLSGIKLYVEDLGFKVIKTCVNGNDAFGCIQSLEPDIVISDINMPGMNGLELLEKVRLENKGVKFILYTMYHEKALLDRAKSLRVNGYLLKDFALEDLAVCLQKVFDYEFWFSPKLEETIVINKHDTNVKKILSLTASERKILELVADDKSSREIGELLFISEKTVEKHRSNIIKKLELPNEKNILQRFAAQNASLKNLS